MEKYQEHRWYRDYERWNESNGEITGETPPEKSKKYPPEQ